MRIYSYTNGVASSVQDFISKADIFLTATIGGWTRIRTISDIGTNRDFVWSSPGEDTSRGYIYIRMRGQSDNIYNYGYGSYGGDGTYGHELFDSSNTYVAAAPAFRYWMFGDKNFICYIILNPSSLVPHEGYLGFIRSYYLPETDRVPLYIRGQTVATNSWTSTTPQGYMHAATGSGQIAVKGYSYYTDYSIADWSLRVSTVNLIPIPIYSDVTASGKEVRGELFGIFHVNGNRVARVGYITTASGIFLTFTNNSAVATTYAYGPISAYQEGFSNY
jgi:hypothetical protein